jgi:hypothetical protein
MATVPAILARETAHRRCRQFDGNFCGHTRAGENPVFLPVSLDTRFRGYDTQAGDKQSLCNITK